MANDSDDDVVIVGETSGSSNRGPTANKRQKREPVEGAGCSGASGSGAAAATGLAITAEGDFALENLQCPICIDLLHQPCVGKHSDAGIHLDLAWQQCISAATLIPTDLTNPHAAPYLPACSAMRPRVLPELHHSSRAQQPTPGLPSLQEPLHCLAPE